MLLAKVAWVTLSYLSFPLNALTYTHVSHRHTNGHHLHMQNTIRRQANNLYKNVPNHNRLIFQHQLKKDENDERDDNRLSEYNDNLHQYYEKGVEIEYNEVNDEAYENEVAFLDELFWNVEISDDDAALFQKNVDVFSTNNITETSINKSVTPNDSPSSILSISDLTENKISPMNLVKLAPASQIAYFYLQSLGLSETTMWKITLEAGSVLGLSVPNLRNKVQFLQTIFSLTDEELQQVLTQFPTILQTSVENNLKPTIQFLEKELLFEEKNKLNKKNEPDLSKLKYMIIQYPCILCYSIPNLKKKLHFFRSSLGLSYNQTSMLLMQNPQLITLSVKQNLQPKVHFFRKELLISKSELRSICLSNPRILLFSLENKMQDILISYFILRLRMEVPYHTTKVLIRFPQIVNYSLQNHLMPTTLYFTETLGLHISEFRTVLVKYPKIMSYSLHKIQRVVAFLDNEFGWKQYKGLGDTNDHDQIDRDDNHNFEVSNEVSNQENQWKHNHLKRIFLQAPQIVGLDIETNLKSKIDFLRAELQSHEHHVISNQNNDSEIQDDISKLITGMPTLLLCNVERNLQPKINYLKSQLGSKTTREVILIQPSLLGYSLEKRIKPRLQRLTQEGYNPRKITSILPLSENKFQDWINKNRIDRDGDQKDNESGRQMKNDKTTGYGLILSSKSSSYGTSIDADKKQQEKVETKRRKARVVHWNRERP